MSWMYGLSLLASSGINAWSASENRKSSESISRLNRDSSEEIARLSRKHSAELQYNQLKFSVLQQRENQEFQRELAELNHERAKEIEAFRAKVSHAINQKNLDFQKWRFEQEKKIQYDILQLQQDFQRELSRLQHQNAVELMRERLRSDKSPIANLPFDLLENSFAHGVMPLKLFLAPPFLDHDPSTGKPLTSGYETYLAEEIEQFLHQGYLASHHHPVQLVDRAWESKKWGGSSALQALHGQLKSIPVLVLESDINLGDLLNFKLGYWSAGDVSYTKATILSGQSYSDLLYSIAKNRALEWEKTRQKLQEIGKDEAFIKEKGGLNEENLQILYKELAEKAEFEEHGLDLTVKKDYKLSNLDYRAFYQYLAVWHCLVIGLYADILFLGNSWENTPLLPSLIPYLLEKYKNHPLLTPEFWQEGIATIVKAYGRFYDSLESDSASCSPEIRMKLALSLANLPDAYKYLALEQGNSALCHWLKANDAPTDKVFDIDSDDDIGLFKRIIYQEDTPFLESLKLLSEQVKDAGNVDINQLSKVNSVLQQWRSLVRFGNIPQLPALVTGGESMTVEEKHKPIMPNITENFTEVLRNGIELEMVAIPAGDFILLGDKPTVVKLKSFWMSKYPITQAQYESIMFYNPSYFRGDSNHPVEQVTWDNTQEFCGKLSEKTDKNYQLPSEVQWMYACKAGSNTKWYFGADEKLEEYAWYEERKYKEPYNPKTHPVGQKKPNQWGLYDMYGNVSEWCQDNFNLYDKCFFDPECANDQGYYFKKSPNYPSDGSAFIGKGHQFVVMELHTGGTYAYLERIGRNRDFLSVGSIGIYNGVLFHQDYKQTLGFRVVCVP